MTQLPTSRDTDPTSAASSRSASERVAALTGRRGVLKIAGVAGVVVGAGALAACSSPPVPAVAGPSKREPAAPSSADGASASVTSDATASSAAGGTPTSEVPVGGGKIFPETKIVVTQPAAGTFKAFDAVCPHQGCTVADVQSNQIICPCHGSHFDATTGARVSGPAETGLTPKKITVNGDTFTVS